MTWTLTLPFTRPPLSLNDRMHWAAKAGITRRVRHAACVLARAQKIPPCERISVQLHYQPRDKRSRDEDNLFLTVKACVDGLKDARVVEDDDSTRVTHLSPLIHPPVPGQRVGTLWLVITPLKEGNE